MLSEWLRAVPHTVGRLIATASLTACLSAATITAKFDTFADGTSLTHQIVGMQFADATILTAGISLNELEFPPHSGTNVASDNGGPISIRFDSPVSSFSVYVTYAVPLKLEEFDTSNNLLASMASRFNSNLSISGDLGSSPNELLQIIFVAPVAISRVAITGSPGGGSFVIDDLTVDTAVAAVPEPRSSGLAAFALCAFAIFTRRASAEHRS